MSNARLYKSDGFECGLILQSLRNKTRLRQQDIATMVGVSVTTVQYWESGTTYPKAPTLKKLLEIFLRFEVFTSGRELTEAQELWEKVRLEAPRLNAAFDRQWFNELLAGLSRDRQLRADQPDRPSVPNNLPGRLTSFIGRKKELTLLSGWLRPVSTQPSVRLVTLSGEGGCGKTSLALEVAREMLGSFPQGVWLVELAPLSTAAAVTQTLAATLGLKEQAGSPLLATITNYLREKRILLVLDNCEHLIEECARVVDSLLRDCPQIVVLATSREVLKVAGETVFRVPSLTLPPLKPAAPPESYQYPTAAFGKLTLVETLMEYEAVQLFVERARAASPTFELNETNQEIVSALCRRLDGIPLAIELAAARLRVLTVFELDARLADRFRLLKSGSDRTVLPRHQTLRATVDWSYELLSESERLLFRRLSVFAGGWTLEAAEEVCTLAGLESEDILDLLHELVNKSLIIVEEQPVELSVSENLESTSPSLRFKLLETLREYGQELLNQTNVKEEVCGIELEGEKQRLQARHLLYYAVYAVGCVPNNIDNEIYDKGTGIKLLASEHNNLREALDWITDDQTQDLTPSLLLAAMDLASATARLWGSRSYFQEAYKYTSLLKVKAVTAGLQSTVQYNWLIYWLGNFTHERGDFEQAKILQEENLAMFTQRGDRRGILRQLYRLAYTLKRLGFNREAYSKHQLSLELAIEAGESFYVASNQTMLGTICIALGDYNEAAGYLQMALKTAREYGDPALITTCLINISPLEILLGKYDAADSYLQESLPLLKELDDKLGLSACLGNLGYLAGISENTVRAVYYFKEALAIQRELGSRRFIALTLSNLAEIVLGQGHYEEAARYNEEALTIKKQIGDRLGVGLSLVINANLARAKGNYKAALTSLAESLTIFWEMEDKHYVLVALLGIAESTLDQLNKLNQEAEAESKTDIYLALAVRLMGVATDSFKSMKETMLPAHEKTLTRIRQISREQMGEQAFEQVFAEGQAMTLEEAVAYALAEK